MLPLLPLLLLLSCSSGTGGSLVGVTDCPSELPDGTHCPADHDNHAYTYPDPEDCSSYYECWNGCMAHLKVS